MIFDELIRTHGISTVPAAVPAAVPSTMPRAGLAMSHPVRPAVRPEPTASGPATTTLAPTTALDELEQVRRSLRQYRVALGDNLAEVVGTLPGAAFGTLVAELLRRTGYTVLGALATTISGSGSASEGLVSRDPLGVERLWLRAVQLPPRWMIDRSHLQGFVDATQLAGLEHGLLISTAVLTAEARTAAARLGAAVTVIDGPRLIELMLQHDLGLAAEFRVTVQRVDPGFFARL
ncbi:restriction endonuclease [Flexivirga meconopsidis]|uniref:restriction endonuclease n=1 Tax=Flexivirga meconopsidis TaxID=2977121 RepID=UPI00223F7B11|nr:restriction endonuclease [Flexivirga meconopsidis]